MQYGDGYVRCALGANRPVLLQQESVCREKLCVVCVYDARLLVVVCTLVRLIFFCSSFFSAIYGRSACSGGRKLVLIVAGSVVSTIV